MYVNNTDIKYTCEECEKHEENNINIIDIKYKRFYLCDDCLQELNRKIVEYLAEKNL